MATDYREVLRELRAEEKRLAGELEIIRGTIPGVELMASRMPTPKAESETLPVRPLTHRPFAGLGTKDAILKLLASAEKPLMPSEIIPALIEGGVITRAADFPGSVSSTLTQMRGDDLIERKDEGWVLTRRPGASTAPMQPFVQ